MGFNTKRKDERGKYSQSTGIYFVTEKLIFINRKPALIIKKTTSTKMTYPFRETPKKPRIFHLKKPPTSVAYPRRSGIYANILFEYFL